MEDKLVIASDGRLALKIKPHTIKKLKILDYYLNEFATAMKPTGRTTGFRGFQQRNYIDLFAGPGRCVVSGQMPSGTEVDGSALIALKVRYPFSNYHFVDIEQKSIDALAQRVAGVSRARGVRFFLGDCNEKVGEVLREIDVRYSANLAVIDSFTIACKWSTVEALAQCKRMDLIINFPMGMSINRNLHNWAENDKSALDDFFGSQKWRDIYEHHRGIAKQCIREFLDLYKRGLAGLDYRVANVHEILISSQGGQKLYYLIFASRSNLGDKFWKNAMRVATEFQFDLFD